MGNISSVSWKGRGWGDGGQFHWFHVLQQVLHLNIRQWLWNVEWNKVGRIMKGESVTNVGGTVVEWTRKTARTACYRRRFEAGTYSFRSEWHKLAPWQKCSLDFSVTNQLSDSPAVLIFVCHQPTRWLHCCLNFSVSPTNPVTQLLSWFQCVTNQPGDPTAVFISVCHQPTRWLNCRLNFSESPTNPVTQLLS
jgi:hypothetical protein